MPMNFAAAVSEGTTLPPSQQPHPDTSLLETGDHSTEGGEFDAEKDKVNVVDEETAEKLRQAIERDEPSEADHFAKVKREAELRQVHNQATNAARLANKIKSDHAAADKAEIAHTKDLVHDVAEEAARKANKLHAEGHDFVAAAEGKATEAAGEVKAEAGKAAQEAKGALASAEAKAEKTGKKLSAEAKEFYADPKNKGREYANAAGKKGAELADEAEDKFDQFVRAAKAEGREVDAEVRAFYADPKNKSKEYVAKGKKAASEAERKADRAAKAAARELRTHPFATSGVVGVVNFALLAGTGYLAYTNWGRPHWDRKVVGAVASAWAVLGGLQAFGYHEIFEQ